MSEGLELYQKDHKRICITSDIFIQIDNKWPYRENHPVNARLSFKKSRHCMTSPTRFGYMFFQD